MQNVYALSFNDISYNSNFSPSELKFRSGGYVTAGVYLPDLSKISRKVLNGF